MKKLFKWTSIIVVLILLSLIILPFFFKDEIVNTIKKEANKNLNAQFDFKDISLNLFSSFPNLALNLKEVSIINYSPFNGDTLLKIESFNTSVDLISLLKGDEIILNSISVKKPQLTLLQLKDGSVNYNIFKNEVEEVEVSQDNSFNLKLKELIVENAKFAYIDQTTNNLIAIQNYNQTLKSEFKDSIVIHNIESSADELTLIMNGIKLFNKLKYNFNLNYSENIFERKFDINDNEFKVNNLRLKFNGSVHFIESGTQINLGFQTARSDFNDILSLIPSFYKKNIQNLETSGKVEINGNINGLLSDAKNPSYNIKMNINDGKVKDKEVNVELDKVNVALSVLNSNGESDNTILDINKFTFLLNNKPFLGSLQIKNPESGPIIETKIKGEIQLNDLNSLISFENIKKLEGSVKTDFEAKGNIGNISQNKFDNFYADGKVSINNFSFLSDLFNYEINVPYANFNFTPNKLVVTNIAAKIGESEIKGSGELLDIFEYYFNKGILKGKIITNSEYFNLNQFIEDDNNKSTNNDSTNFSAHVIPSNINLLIDGKFIELVYDNLNLHNVIGQVLISDGKISIKNARMNLFNGSLLIDGFYEHKNELENPQIDFNIGINDFSISETYSKFLSVRKFVPMAKYIKGKFDSNIKLNSKLNAKLEPIWEDFYSSGNLFVQSAEIENYKPFTALGNLLNIEELSNPKIQKVNPNYKIEKGRFQISPIDFKIKDYNINFSGSNGINESIDYVFKIMIPSTTLKNKANQSISNILGKDLKLISSEKITVNAFIKGFINSPQISTNASETVESITKELVEEVKKEILEKVESTVDSLKIKAEEKLKEEVSKKEAELKKKEEELKKKLEEEAKKKLQNLFKKKG